MSPWCVVRRHSLLSGVPWIPHHCHHHCWQLIGRFHYMKALSSLEIVASLAYVHCHPMLTHTWWSPADSWLWYLRSSTQIAGIWDNLESNLTAALRRWKDKWNKFFKNTRMLDWRKTFEIKNINRSLKWNHRPIPFRNILFLWTRSIHLATCILENSFCYNGK